MGNQAAMAGLKLAFNTNTPKILSKKINKNPRATPKARFTPIPPRRLKEVMATAIMVYTKAEAGILQRL